MLFSPRSSYYPKVRKFKKWKRRKQTINFRVYPLTNTSIHSSKVFNQSTLIHRLSNQRFTNNLGVTNWVQLRQTNFTSNIKTRLIRKSLLKAFPLISTTPLSSDKGYSFDSMTVRDRAAQKRPRYGQKRLSHRRSPRKRFFNKYKALRLKKHIHYRVPVLHDNTPSKSFATWIRHETLKSYSIVRDNSVFSLEDKNSPWYLQNLSTNPYLNRSFIYTQLAKVLMLWLLRDSEQVTGVVHLTNRSYMNDRILSLNQFFNFNRLTMLKVSKNDLVASKIVDSKAQPFSRLFYRCIISTRTKSLKYVPAPARRLTQQKSWNSTLLLSYRYIPFLSVQSAFRSLRGRGTLGTHQLNRRRSTRPAVSLTSGVAPLFVFPATRVNRCFKPYIGLAAGIRLMSNDNMIENCVDNHMLRMSYDRFQSSVRGLAYSLKLNMVAWDHSEFIRYLKPCGISRKQSLNVAKNSLLPQSRQLFISKSSLVFSSERLNKELYKNPILFKYLLWNQDNLHARMDAVITKPFLRPFIDNIHRFNFSSRISLYEQSNLWSSTQLNYVVKRKLVKRLHTTKFVPNVTMWYYETLVKFIEHHTSKRVYLKFNPFIENAIPFVDLARCSLWEPRVQGFQKILGHRIFVFESLRILTLALRFRDPAFLSHWMKTMLYRMSFWKYRLLFRYVKFTMRYLFFPYFADLGFKGLKFVLRGKISVAGNARTRTLVYAIGETSHAKVNNRVLSEFTTINSFTGVMGFLVSFYF